MRKVLPQNIKHAFQSKPLWRIFGGVLALILIYSIIDYFRTHPDVFKSLQNLDLQDIVLAIILDIIVVSAFALRTFVVLNCFSGWSLPYWSWLRIHVIGQILNFFIAQVGDMYRAHAAKSQSNLPYANYAGVFLFVSWLDMVITLTLASGLRTIVTTDVNIHDLPFTTLVASAAICFAIAPVGTLILGTMSSIHLCPAALQQWIKTLLKEFWRPLWNLKLDIYLILIALFSFSIMTLMVLAIFQGLGAQIALYQAALIITVYRFSQAISFTPGNIGVREWSIGGLCLLLGLDPGHGLLFSLIMRAVHLTSLVITGGTLVMSQHLNLAVAKEN